MHLSQGVAHGIAAHVQSEVVHVVIDVGEVPLVRAVGILVTGALVHNIGVVLVPLARDVGESLVHGHVGHHVLVVGDAVAVGEVGGGPGGELIVAHTRGAEVEHSQRRQAALLEVNGGKGGHGGAEGVAGHDDSVGRVLGLEGLHIAGDSGNHGLLGLVEALVHLAARASGVGSQHGIQVVHPVLNRGGAAEDDVDGRLGRHGANVRLRE